MSENIIYNQTKTPFKLNRSGEKTLCLPKQGICKDAYPIEAGYLEEHNRRFKDLDNE